ncbi:MAG: hypothetical protein U0Y68_15465 [Blastocatellia bacterium]
MQRIITVGLLLALCFGVAHAQPQSPLPAPTGSYAVGRTIFNWIDESRVDLLSAKGYREIPVWVWYPAAPASAAQLAEWLPGLWGEIFAGLSTPPGKEKYSVNTIRAHSFADAPVATGQGKYPVILFAPGYGSGPGEYTSLIEDLVSRGYIVAGIVPTYFSQYTVFANGRVVGQLQVARDLPGVPREVANRPDATEPHLRLWVGDLRFALNQLEKLNAEASSPLRGRLDFTRVGVLGHSFGATAASQLAKQDVRVHAAVTMDGSLMSDVFRDPRIPKPLLLMQSAMMQGKAARNPQLKGRKPEEMLTLLRSAKPGYFMTIAGTMHSFASDMGMLPFAQPWPPIINTKPARALAIARAYIAAFFDQSLLGKSSALLNGPSSDYSEVTFENNFDK